MGAWPLAGKVALVTGAGRRLGRAIAVDLGAGGCRVAVHYRDSGAAAADTVATIAAAGGEAAGFAADLREPAAVEGLVEAVVARFGGLDVVVASAAVYARTPWAAVTLDDWRFHLDSNLTSTFLLVRAAAPRMRDGGAIVTIGDWAGLRPYRDYLPYCVSKAGVIALTQALAQELAPRLRVNCVCPGSMLPPPHADPEARARIAAQTPLGRLGSPEDVVAAVRFLVAGTDFATGSILTVDGGRMVANGLAY